MVTIIIDGQAYQTREGITVLQAALENGFDIPHYCYHPGLHVVGSCRLCLMEIKMPHPETKEMTWSPKLMPSCQVMVRDGMEVRFNSQKVRDNRAQVMEYYLIDHPLDCPVCDQAGECYLQDYSLKFGTATSRAIDPKHKNPKKNIGPHTLLYMDRCVLCTRCVRFAQEIAGTGELCVVNRGSRAEIDVFPGQQLDNKLQGNVVDICPVGALLDKDFLHKQRAWFLESTDSICRGCSSGCAIHVDYNREKGKVWRLCPRYNPGVNDWWICDEGRFGWKFVEQEGRITTPVVRAEGVEDCPRWELLPEMLRNRLRAVVTEYGEGALGVQLSPEMACEEAWLLVEAIRQIDPQARLALGDVQAVGEDERFPVGCAQGEEKFVIRAEKNPNRRGIETVLEAFGGQVLSKEELWGQVSRGAIKGLWVAGGYPQGDWASDTLLSAVDKTVLAVVQDTFAGALSEKADVVLPFCAWVEREGSFMNHAGTLQPYKRAVSPPEGAVQDGQYLYALAGYKGLYNAGKVRAMMAEKVSVFGKPWVPPPKPRHQH